MSNGLYLYLLIILPVAGIIYLFRNKPVISLSVTDFSVLAFLLYGLLHTGIVQDFRCDPLVWFKWTALWFSYLFFRRLNKPRAVLYGIVLYGLFQSIVAGGQALSLLPSSHRFFPITGTIGNPGPLGGLLAIATVCGATLFRQSLREKTSRRRIRMDGSFTCILLAGLLLTDSRAAFLNVLVGLLIVWGDEIRTLLKKHKAAVVIILVPAVALLCCALYFYRPASADSRLLIWQVSAGIIADKPLSGHGIGAFDRIYMLHQAAYFGQHPQSSFIMVADNAAYPYNEWIHVLIELGLTGALLLLAVFISGLTGRWTKAGLATFILFSLFSYPSEVFELMLLPVALLGSSPGKSVCRLRILRSLQFAGMGLLAGIIFCSVTGISVLHKVSGEIRQLRVSGVPVPAPYCERYFSLLVYNADFNMTYLSALCRFPFQPEALSKIKCIFPSSEAFCLSGRAYECCGQYRQAEQFYRQAADMVPNRISPAYHLWRLYVKTADHSRACATAEKILSMPVKKENTFTLRAKGEVKRYLLYSCPE